MEITNITTLVEALGKLGEPKQGYTRFFRGHSKLSYDLEPSIYRIDKKNSPNEPAYLIKNEDKIIRDALTNCPDSFSPSDTLFEKLVKLQHYGYATRLLDLTTNALVALYFAVQSKREDGEFVVLDIPDTEIKYDDSDVVSILSAISLRSQKFNIKGYMDFAERSGIVAQELFLQNNGNLLTDQTTTIISTYKKDIAEGLNVPFAAFFERGASESYQKKYLETFNKQPEIARLLHDIRHDKPSFAPVINPKDFNRVVCVRAKLNNPRIIRQQGCFLLFGINNEKLTKAEVENSWKRTLPEEHSSGGDNRFIIKDEAKEQILDELKSFGISHQNLFPELDAQAQDIMGKYRRP